MFNLNYLLKSLSPNTVTLEVRTSTYEFWGGTQFSHNAMHAFKYVFSFFNFSFLQCILFAAIKSSLRLFTSTILFTVTRRHSFSNSQRPYFHMYFISRLLWVNNHYATDATSYCHLTRKIFMLSSTIWAAKFQNPILKVSFLEALLIPTIVSFKALAGNRHHALIGWL